MQDEILEKYQIRKSNKEKTEFINYIKQRLAQSGYDMEQDIRVEEKGKGVFKSRNIVVGNPEKAEVFITAHYDTCSVLPFPNFMAPTNPLLFWGFQILLAFVLMFGAGFLTLGFALLTNNYFNAGSVYLVILLLMLWHLMFGYRNKHTANDNTSGVLTITRILEELPKEHREKVCVVYFDNEEKGLFGSSFFAKKHKKTVKNKMLINLDCVGDGNNVVAMAKHKARKDSNYSAFVEALNTCSEKYEGRCLHKNMMPMMFPSDQSNFSNSIGVCTLRKSFLGMYTARIHTPFDTICREENIRLLTDAMKEFIGRI